MLMKLLMVAVESLPDTQGNDEIGARENYRKLALVLIDCISRMPPRISIGDFVLLVRKLAIRISSSSDGGLGEDETMFGLDQQLFESEIKLHLVEGELHSQTKIKETIDSLWVKALGKNMNLRQQNQELRGQVSKEQSAVSRLELDSQRVRLLYTLLKRRFESSN